ncbi:MAG: hypothetical protein ACYCX2_04605 [Christensenellales bacterium]
MNRITKPLDGNRYFIADESAIQHDESGYSGQAVTRLARFENIYEDLLFKQSVLSKEMEKLRLENKTKTIRFKQLFTNKLMNSQIITIFESYGCNQ